MSQLELSLLEQIEGICQSRGVRLTPQRKRVFELIFASKSASSAYDLLDRLKESEPQAKPPTVYRALDFLLEQGFIHRVESTNSFISCCSFGTHKHFSHLLICDKCGNVAEHQDDQLVALLAKNSEKQGFQLTNHVIETHGTCKSCFSDFTDK
ncbi:transcriptional regulator Zur [Vibrio sp. vnigr-6D03]|uniref:zinc uptake transcriptional repressor Zur n=1 Tax=Vibrio TaxID=662 RepID=UPI000C341A5D|nr:MULTISPECIES: zinc uptake transcriptional repressor Zur [Vibrio]MDP2573239.1 zinc uptake transcriptional repressor Zur [Vibrio penaeicida]PKF77869.1 transcriptional regulator Zur [Vibrio sp. vnigr-6D03]RTZ19126.1 zinc uptake transcriptional repressor Zur [Vibrio penaeicida]